MLRRQEFTQPFHPAYVVWELTLACDQRCTHCGSRAESARDRELTTAEALEVVSQLARMGSREVVLIGGEAYLHPGFLEIIAALKAAGIRPTMTTGGRGIDRKLALAMAGAGLYAASVSIDGMGATHDAMRATVGGFEAALASLRLLREAGIRTAANTNFNRFNKDELLPLYEVLKTAGISAWQVQITAPLGRAADRPDMILQPWDLLTLVPEIVALKARAFEEARIVIMPANNLGYFGTGEVALRSHPTKKTDHWIGCPAGKYAMGIESDGAVKGCPSLQTSHYVGGRAPEQPLEEIWNTAPQLTWNRTRTVEDLWGFCRTCPFASHCLGGCTFTAHSVLGRPGNNPYCVFRASTLQKQGKRERLVRKQPAPGLPFDNGRFELVEEPFDAPDPKPPSPALLLRRR